MQLRGLTLLVEHNEDPPQAASRRTFGSTSEMAMNSPLIHPCDDDLNLTALEPMRHGARSCGIGRQAHPLTSHSCWCR